MSEPPAAVPTADVPPGVEGDPGWLLSRIKDQRVAFFFVGAINTAIGFAAFIFFQHFVGRHLGRYGYMATLGFAHVFSVLCAFWLYRHIVFRVRGHVWRDLARFESVYLSALAVNAALLPLLVELAHLTPLVAQLGVLFITSAISWFGHKHFSFRRRSHPEAETPTDVTDPNPHHPEVTP